MKKRTKTGRPGRLKKALSVIILAAAVALAALLMFGGEGFRWFGEKSEKAGESIRERSEELGQKADELREDVEKKAGELKEEAGEKAGEIKEDVKKKVAGE